MRENTVLIVDDDADILEGLSEVLALEGYKIVVAGDGEKAMEMLDTEHPDLVLLDIRMPNMDGLSFLNKAQRLHSLRTFPVVLMSGNVPSQQVLDRVDDFLQKPMDLDTLYAVLRKHSRSPANAHLH